MNLSRILTLPLFLLGAAALAAPMTNDDIVKMVKAGLDEAIIVSSIQNSESKFDTSSDGLIDLSDAKVPKTIVTAIIERAAGKTAAPAAGATRKTPLAEAGVVDVQSVMMVDGDQEVRMVFARTEMTTRVRGLGFGGGAAYLCMDGTSAKLRIKNRTPLFYAWLPSDGVPEQQVDLVSWAARKNGTREVMCANVGGMGGSTRTGFPRERMVVLTLTSMKEQSPDGRYVRYEIRPQSMAPGEYALVFGVTGTPRCYDLAIEP